LPLSHLLPVGKIPDRGINIIDKAVNDNLTPDSAGHDKVIFSMERNKGVTAIEYILPFLAQIRLFEAGDKNNALWLGVAEMMMSVFFLVRQSGRYSRKNCRNSY
jgi:hypothetical protein